MASDLLRRAKSAPAAVRVELETAYAQGGSRTKAAAICGVSGPTFAKLAEMTGATFPPNKGGRPRIAAAAGAAAPPPAKPGAGAKDLQGAVGDEGGEPKDGDADSKGGS